MTLNWRVVMVILGGFGFASVTVFSMSQCTQVSIEKDSLVRQACFQKAQQVEDCQYTVRYGATSK